MRPAVFLDRDGTINREVDFLATPDQLELLPGVPEALRRLHAAGYALVITTNQSGIARGYYTERDLARIHDELHAQVGRLPLAYLHCPHHPDGGHGYGRECACRKPKDGMLHHARELLGVSLTGGAVIGDSARDILMARQTDLTTILVRSGKPIEPQRAQLDAAGVRPDHEAADLPAAVDWLLREERA